MNRIIEAFTRAHDQVTGIDEIIMFGTALIVAGVLLVIYVIVVAVIKK